jgi:hypothetical protein
LSQRSERLLGPSLSALRQVALFAWVPLLTAWFGLGEGAKLVFVALAAFFPLLIATQRGIASLSPQLGEAAQALRLGLGNACACWCCRALRRAIFAGLRLSLIYAWLGTIGAEYFMPSDGGIASLMIGAAVPHGPGDGRHAPDRPGRRPARPPRPTPRIARHALEIRMNAFITPALHAANQPDATPPLVSFERSARPSAWTASRSKPSATSTCRSSRANSSPSSARRAAASPPCCACWWAWTTTTAARSASMASGQRHRRRARHRVPGAPPVPRLTVAQNIALGWSTTSHPGRARPPGA